jgi:transcriptional regulator with XRE-family HTH domain
MTRIKFERLKANLRQQDVENETGVKKYRLSLAEAGNLKLTAAERIKLAEFFGIQPEEVSQVVSASPADQTRKTNQQTSFDI